MPVIDNEGRLFGRLNLIDALAVLFVILLIPVAYTSYVLFRTPAPTISAIEPSTVPLIDGEMRVKVRGDGLRPLLRAFIGDTPARAYLYENEHSVDVLFAGVRAGRHDFSLFDGVQEVLRVPNGITVAPPPQQAFSHVVVGGVFVGLTQNQASQIAVGQRVGAENSPEVELLEVGPPRPDFRFVTANDVNVVLPVEGQLQVPALVRLRCYVNETGLCISTGGAIEARRAMMLPHPSGGLRFVVDFLEPDDPGRAADVTVRFFLAPEAVGAMKIGDRDLSLSNVGAAARIDSIGRTEIASGETARLVGDAGGGSVERRTSERYAVFNAVLRLVLHDSPYGWRYRSQLVRVGGPFTFNGSMYQASGSVVSIRFADVGTDGQ